MYTIEQTDFGFQITFAGKMDEEELREWAADSRAALRSSPDEFGVLVDMRDLKLLSDDEQRVMREGQQHYQDAGMVRSSVILDSAILTLQFRRLAGRWHRSGLSMSHTDSCRWVPAHPQDG
ncbi:hypothetical protein [Haloterrigena sp. H1]|uniref:hypothetical protein n=1 Tax=Haloterrigena sp. H1 TaxID=2552943 RepID=UPI002016F0C0|nr:hypothetical protein [Haloterrigena sp. H1]